MRPIANILKARTSSTVYSTTPDATVFSALRLMADKNVGALLVMQDGQIVGIFSERDYARKIALFDLSSRDTTVSKIMSSPVIFVAPSQTSRECMALMTRNRLRHLPVLDDGELVGIVSIGDLVKEIIAELEFSNEQLVDYIHGGHGASNVESPVQAS